MTVRVTLPREVWAELEARAEQEGTAPGTLLATVYLSRQEGQQDADRGGESVVAAEPPSAPSLEGVTALRVVSATISQRTRNGLRWPAANYQKTEALLAQGDAICLHREAGKDKWRTAHGDAIRRDTLLKLMQSGNLKPLT